MATEVEKIAVKAREDRNLIFTSLAHHITKTRLWGNLKQISNTTSAGVDAQDVKGAKETFATWSVTMLQAMHNKGYHPPPTRRVYIPKPGKDEKRPISIPTLQDRCLQKSVTDVLTSIYEQDFLNCSYGGRPGRSAHHAIASLQDVISGQKVSWVYEFDLRNFFGSLNQDWVERFLKHRVGDPRITTLVKRWLKAGVMEDGQYLPTEQGTAQGGPISVLISNIYLHYVLDVWIEKVVRPRMRGYMYYTRYLDDFVLCFQYESDANRFRSVLNKRLEKFSLSLEPLKTKLLEFGRYADKRKNSGKKGKTFNFLGFTFYCTKNRKGGFKVGMKTEKSRLRRSCAKIKEMLLHIRHNPVREQWKLINVRLVGHYNYYGVGGNIYAIDHFYYFTLRFWRKALSSRSQNGKVNWAKFNHILKLFPLRQPKLFLPYAAMKSLVTL